MLEVFFSRGTQCLLDFHLLGQRYTLITECEVVKMSISDLAGLCEYCNLS